MMKVSSYRADDAAADEDGGGGDGCDGIATYETISTTENRRERGFLDGITAEHSDEE